IQRRFDTSDDLCFLPCGYDQEPHRGIKKPNQRPGSIEHMLQNKQGIIFGVANKRSIAWATAQALHGAGARLGFAYQGERLKDNVESLTKAEMPDSPLFSCDVTKQEEVDATFKRIGEDFGRLDFLVHSIAYAPREALEGEFMKVERDAFLTALEI